MDPRPPFRMAPCTVYETIINQFVFPFGATIGVDYAIGVRLHELSDNAHPEPLATPSSSVGAA